MKLIMRADDLGFSEAVNLGIYKAVGDKVVKINGKPAKKYDFCESILNGIPELKEKKKTKLTIETASGVKDIIYEKE